MLNENGQKRFIKYINKKTKHLYTTPCYYIVSQSDKKKVRGKKMTTTNCKNCGHEAKEGTHRVFSNFVFPHFDLKKECQKGCSCTNPEP